jgi:membrane-associated phospholipid phosphatase
MSVVSPEREAALRRHWLAAGVAALTAFGFVLALVWSSGGTDSFDAAITLDVIGLRSPQVTPLARSITALGAFPAVVGVTVLIAVVLWRRTRSIGLSLALPTAVVVTAGLVYLLKSAVSRPRPPIHTLLGVPSTDFSFPSGHTTNGSVVYLLSALLLATTLERRWQRRLLVVLGGLIGLAVGLTRVYLGFHWATDVVAGWLLAAAVVSIARACSPVVIVSTGWTRSMRLPLDHRQSR